MSAKIGYGDLPRGRELWGRATYCYFVRVADGRGTELARPQAGLLAKKGE